MQQKMKNNYSLRLITWNKIPHVRFLKHGSTPGVNCAVKLYCRHITVEYYINRGLSKTFKFMSQLSLTLCMCVWKKLEGVSNLHKVMRLYKLTCDVMWIIKCKKINKNVIHCRLFSNCYISPMFYHNHRMDKVFF